MPELLQRGNVPNLGWTTDIYPRADSCCRDDIIPGKTQKSSCGFMGVKAPDIFSSLSQAPGPCVGSVLKV